MRKTSEKKIKVVLIDKKISHIKFFLKFIKSSIIQVFFFTNLIKKKKLFKLTQAILVSSTTKLKKEYFVDSNLKFIGSPTSGLNHIALDLLNDKAIKVATAKGINRWAVCDYIWAVIFLYVFKQNWQFNHITLGIIGYGVIGQAVAKVARRLNVKTIIYDPYQVGYEDSRILWKMSKADIITLHVPLTKTGNFSTFQMVDAEYFRKILPSSQQKNKKKNPLIINTARGEIFNPQDLQSQIREKKIDYVFDVWPQEPILDPFLLKNAWLATPHIAGYSQKGKWLSSEKIFHSFMDFLKLNKKDNLTPKTIIEKVKIPLKFFNQKKKSNDLIVEYILEKILALNKTTQKLKHTILKSDLEKKKTFFALRKKYLLRKEFSEIKVELNAYQDQELLGWLKILKIKTI